jgi:DNA-directed RNA polymerase subunit omega
MGQTSEDAVNAIGNRYEMVLIASLRARELRRGHQSKLIKGGNGKLITALKEIEQGLIGRDYLKRIR